MADEIFFAKGKRSKVYLTTYNKAKAVKKVADPSFVSNVRNEAYWLLLLNKRGIGPKLFCFGNNFIVVEFIDGKRILDYLSVSSKQKVLKVIVDVLLQCKVLDDMFVDKKELTNPYKHIIVRNSKPIMIDFERCRKTASPKNVTQFIQFLTSKKVLSVLASKGVVLDVSAFRSLARSYKKSHKGFSTLLSLLQNHSP